MVIIDLLEINFSLVLFLLFCTLPQIFYNSYLLRFKL